MKEKKAAAAAAPTAAKNKSWAATVPASKKRESSGAGRGKPRKRARDLGDGDGDGDPPSHGDLISTLPDDILGTVISLLPIKDGARTQVLARRWCPLWRSSPLNLSADCRHLCSNELKSFSIVSKILSDHNGPCRRFVFNYIPHYKAKKRLAEDAAQIESLFRSRALANLQDLLISFQDILDDTEQEKLCPLPPSVFLCASTLVKASISSCDFPKEIVPSVSFPLLKMLTLYRVSISEDVFHGVLSCCHVLESLSLGTMGDVGRFRISSPTLRSVVLGACFSGKGELVIEDTPLLERLVTPYPGKGGDTIRVIRAPKLQTLGFLSPCLAEIMIANLVFQSLRPTSLRNTISTLKILALKFSVPDLNAVIDVLRCFPCLEKLHVIWYKLMPKKKALHYDSPDPVKCLETHLKELVLKNYECSEEFVSFAKFFVLNAKVLKQIKVKVNNEVNEEWVADQHRLLEVGSGASRDVQLIFEQNDSKWFDAHNFSIADPFTC